VLGGEVGRAWWIRSCTVAEDTPCRRAAPASDDSPFTTANTTWICSSTDTCRDGFCCLLTQPSFPIPQPNPRRKFDSLQVDIFEYIFDIVSAMGVEIARPTPLPLRRHDEGPVPDAGMLPVLPALRELLPGGLRRGTVVAVGGWGLLCLAVVAGASAAGAWCAAVGMPQLGVAAAAEAGLDRINVSLDTLRPDVFRTLAKRDRLTDVLAGLAAAAGAGLVPVKVNTVLMQGVNSDEAVPLLRFCLERGYQLRFIEQMPLDAQHGWRRENMVTADEILAALTAEFPLTPDDEQARGSAPAETFLVDGGPARVGVIGSVTRPFCGACDRVRLTADGQVRNCLFARTESNLRDPMRAGASDEELARIWRRAVAAKLPGHGINDPGFLQPARPMSAIGG
jgi:hypothetical protein